MLAVVAIAAFGVAFFVARAASDEPDPPAPQTAQPLAVPPVTINNLERAPSMKPLRSVAGEPMP